MIDFKNSRKFVLSLLRRPDRKIEFSKSANIVGLTNWQFYQAIDGNELEWDGKSPLPTAERHLKMSIEERQRISCGQIACRLSHQGILKTAKELNLPYCIIIEDDADFDPFIHKKLENWLHQLPSDWEMLYLGAHNYKPLRMVSDNIGKCVTSLSTIAYIVNSSAYDKIISALDSPQILDIIYCNDLNAKGLINAYCVKPNLVVQRSGFSDIEMLNVDYKQFYKKNQ